MDERMMIVLQGIGMLLVALMLTAWAVWYVMESAALFVIAKRRGFSRCWVAWFPVARLSLRGALVDQYVYLSRGKHRNMRLFLLLSGIGLGAFLPTIVYSALWLLYDQAAFDEIIGRLGLFLIFPVVYAVLRLLSSYRIFRSCTGKSGNMYFIVSLLIPMAESALLLWCCRRDDGMPPRKEIQH